MRLSYPGGVSALVRRPVHFLAFGFGTGLAPKAPGTVGTLAALPFYFGMLALGLTPLFYALVVLALLLVGVWLCHQTAADLGVHDHPGIVWDEIVGYLIAMFLVPASWQGLVLGFALFRLFDIWKPFPIGYLDRHVSGGWGIMLDDVVAGLYALGVLHALIWWYGASFSAA